jgi:hypothetical protein
MYKPTDRHMTVETRFNSLAIVSTNLNLELQIQSESLNIGINQGLVINDLSLILVLILELGDNRGIGERCGIAQDAALGDVAQQAAHDFRAARLG